VAGDWRARTPTEPHPLNLECNLTPSIPLSVNGRGRGQRGERRGFGVLPKQGRHLALAPAVEAAPNLKCTQMLRQFAQVPRFG
jgi:hypothetical protein